MSVFSNIITSVKEAAAQSTAIVTSSTGYQTIRTASTAATTTSVAIGSKQAAFKVGQALGHATKVLAYSLRSNFISSLVILEVADVVERHISKRQLKKEIRELSDVLARTVPLPDPLSQAQREADVQRLQILEDMLPKRRSFKRFLLDLPQRIARRIFRAAKTAIGTTGAVWTAPLALGTFLVDFIWRVGVIVPIKAWKSYKGQEFNTEKWTKYTGAALTLGIKPFFYFLHVMVDGVTRRTWLEPSDVVVFEQVLKQVDLTSPTCSREDCEDAYMKGFQTMTTYRAEKPRNSVLLYGLILRTAAERHRGHNWLFSYSEGVRDASPWMFKDLATADLALV